MLYLCAIGVGLAVAAYPLMTTATAATESKTDDLKENFWNNIQLTARVIPEVYNPKTGVTQSMSGSVVGLPQGGYGHQFITTPSYQAILSPRFDNSNPGAHLRYNMPDEKYRAAPQHPLTYGEMATEGYAPKCSGMGGVASPQAGGRFSPPSPTAPIAQPWPCLKQASA